MKMKISVIVVAIPLLFATKMSAQSSMRYWSSLSSGFTVNATTSIVLKSDVGEGCVGVMQGGDRRVESGFLVTPTLRGTVSVPEHAGIPGEFTLHQNYPNPFNPVTTIQYTLPEQAHVLIKLYNTLGQEVVTLVDEEQQAGYRSVTWDAHNSPSGAYFYRMRAGSYTALKKLLVIK